jgi:hypothetical protein
MRRRSSAGIGQACRISNVSNVWIDARRGRSSYAAAFLVRIFHLLERVLGSMESNRDCGGSSRESSRRSAPKSSSSRTSERSCGEASELSSPSLPASGSMRNGALSARPMLVRRTSEIAHSSSRHKAPYPTPTASPYGKSGNARGHEERRRESLDSMAAGWATPVANDGGSQGSKPRQREDSGAAAYPTSDSHHNGTTLTDAARLHDGRPVEAIERHGPNGLVLCPEFVEMLMGLPVGWTLVDVEREPNALVTPSSRRKRQPRSSSCGGG